MLRKQAFTSLVALLSGVSRWRPDVVMGSGQGALIVGLAGVPLVLEAACRARIVTLAEMKEFRIAWGRIKALIVVNPMIVPQGAGPDGSGGRWGLQTLTAALPELLKTQPTGIYREVVLTKKCIQRGFVREFGDLIAAPPENERFRTQALRKAMETVPHG